MTTITMRNLFVCLVTLALFVDSTVALQCRECAFLDPDTGVDTIDTVIKGVYGWTDTDCLTDPSSYPMRTCESFSQACVSMIGEAEIDATVLGQTITDGSFTLMYRNCSQLEDPPTGCGTESMEKHVTEEILNQTASLFDLSAVEFDIVDVESSACYCANDGCNNSTDLVADAEEAEHLTCFSCNWAKGGKKQQKALRKLLPGEADNQCASKPDAVKKGEEKCGEDEICAAVQLDISAYKIGRKKKQGSGEFWVRGCVDKALAVEEMGCFNLDDYKSETGNDFSTAMESFFNMKPTATSGAVCFCDDMNCNDHTDEDLGEVAEGTECIDSCEGMANGYYHKCGGCNSYFKCRSSAKKNKPKKCKRKHWDNKKEKCVKKGTSETCS